MIKLKKILATAFAVLSACIFLLPITACGGNAETVVLRVCSWEEYIDLGDWDEEDRIEIDSNISSAFSLIKTFIAVMSSMVGLCLGFSGFTKISLIDRFTIFIIFILCFLTIHNYYHRIIP